jgi:hypothetical protein
MPGSFKTISRERLSPSVSREGFFILEVKKVDFVSDMMTQHNEAAGVKLLDFSGLGLGLVVGSFEHDKTP